MAGEHKPQVSRTTRREFLKDTGLAAAGAAILDGSAVFHGNASAVTTEAVREIGPGAVAVTLRVNGQPYTVQVEPRITLADTLRLHLGLTGTKVSCDHGACSSCTVLMDGLPINSCMTLTVEVGARTITTIEGMARGEELHPVQAAFVKHDAMQCGFCTPGMVMSCAALLERKPRPALHEVREAISGNLCRCGCYTRICEATLDAAEHIAAKRSVGGA